MHNAGASQSAAVSETAAEVDQQMMALNVTGPISLTKVGPKIRRHDEGHSGCFWWERRTSWSAVGNVVPACLQAVLKRMLEGGRRGQFIVVSSLAAKIPSPGQATYSASKAAFHMFMASLQAEVADAGISGGT